jgi:hypothetical protein
MVQELQHSLDTITNKLNRIIELLELSSPKNSKELLLESIMDPNFTNNDIGLPGGVYQFDAPCGDKLCECGK